MNSGFIKLHRQIMKWEWYTDANTVRLFFHLLLSANYKASRYRGHEVPAGALVSGRKKLALELGLSERNVRTALNHLKTTGEVTIKATRKFSIISMANWEEYQDTDQRPDQQVTSKRPTGDQQVTTSKEGKKVRKKEKIYPENSNSKAEYAFESGVIKINQRDLDQLIEAHPNVAVKSVLLANTEWAAKQRNWFMAVKGLLAKKEREAALEFERVRAEVVTPEFAPHTCRMGI